MPRKNKEPIQHLQIEEESNSMPMDEAWKKQQIGDISLFGYCRIIVNEMNNIYHGSTNPLQQMLHNMLWHVNHIYTTCVCNQANGKRKMDQKNKIFGIFEVAFAIPRHLQKRNSLKQMLQGKAYSMVDKNIDQDVRSKGEREKTLLPLNNSTPWQLPTKNVIL